MWKIKMRGRENSEVLIEDEEYKTIVQNLNKAKLFKLESGTVINSVDIQKIEPYAEPQSVLIPKERRLSHPADTTSEEKSVKVLGGWQKPSVRKKMTELFNRLKSQGCFKGKNSYLDWEKEKYQEEIVPELKRS